MGREGGHCPLQPLPGSGRGQVRVCACGVMTGPGAPAPPPHRPRQLCVCSSACPQPLLRPDPTRKERPTHRCRCRGQAPAGTGCACGRGEPAQRPCGRWGPPAGQHGREQGRDAAAPALGTGEGGLPKGRGGRGSEYQLIPRSPPHPPGPILSPPPPFCRLRSTLLLPATGPSVSQGLHPRSRPPAQLRDIRPPNLTNRSAPPPRLLSAIPTHPHQTGLQAYTDRIKSLQLLP
jgi:hypothetical protein